MKSTSVLARLTAFAAVTAVLCVALPASAQGFKWWQADNFKKELGLTAEQTRRLEETFQKALPALKVQKSTLDEAERKFEQLVERGDDSAVMEQVNVVEAARAELNKTRTMMLLNMRKALTKDQWARFTALHQATERERAAAAQSGK
jgi:Spy/CpxP family protein refolding chaperone